MLLAKLHAYAFGPMWIRRTPSGAQTTHATITQDDNTDSLIVSQTTLSDHCPVCSMPWWIVKHPKPQAIVVIESWANDPAQKILLHHLLHAFWESEAAVLACHASCGKTEEMVNICLSYSPKQIMILGLTMGNKILPNVCMHSPIYYHHTPTIVTHTLSAMLDNPDIKAQVWADCCALGHNKKMD